LDNSQIGTLIKTIGLLNHATIKLYKMLNLAKYMCSISINQCTLRKWRE